MNRLTLEEATALALEGKLNNLKLDPQKIVNFVNDSIEFLLENNEGCCEYELDNDLSIFCGWSDGYDKNDESGIKPSNEEESTWRINVGIKCNHEYLKTDFDWLNFPYDKETGDVVDTGLTVQEGGISVEDAQWLIDEYRGIREALDNGEVLLENKKKTEGIQDDRLANSIKWLKDSGYEEYKTGDKYTLLINTTKYDGQVVGVMFYGKSAKPQWHYRFRNMEELDNYTDKFLSNRAANEKSDAERREKRKLTKDHDIKVGDIFYTSWGYDQTNIDYYEVVAVRGSRIDLKELHQKYVGHEGQEDLVAPATGDNRFKDDKIYTVSARADGTVTSLSSFEYPRKWDGKPDRQTDAYSGH